MQLASELELSKGTVHGLLRTLQLVGYVEQDPDTSKYQLGAALLPMGSLYLSGNKLRALALNWSDSLAARTQQTVRIGTLHDQQVLIVHHVLAPDDSFQTLDVGSLLPAHATALGKVLLAGNPLVLSDVIGLGPQSFTDATICNPQRLLQELSEIAERNWAADIGELQAERASIAAPITDDLDHTVGAIGIFGSCDRLLAAGRPREQLVTYVCDAAQEVSRQLRSAR